MVSSLKEEKCAYLLSKEYTTSCEADMLEAEMNSVQYIVEMIMHCERSLTVPHPNESSGKGTKHGCCHLYL